MRKLSHVLMAINFGKVLYMNVSCQMDLSQLTEGKSDMSSFSCMAMTVGFACQARYGYLACENCCVHLFICSSHFNKNLTFIIVALNNEITSMVYNI